MRGGRGEREGAAVLVALRLPRFLRVREEARDRRLARRLSGEPGEGDRRRRHPFDHTKAARYVSIEEESMFPGHGGTRPPV